jgi:predicted nuclease of predicted toxin-antitoxin system
MSVQLVIDMNLSPEWVDELARHGWSAVHWSKVGDPRAEDAVIMDWARSNGHVVFTHDLDFGTMLALAHANGPSVLQVRAQETRVGPHAPQYRRCDTIYTTIGKTIGDRNGNTVA